MHLRSHLVVSFLLSLGCTTLASNNDTAQGIAGNSTCYKYSADVSINTWGYDFNLCERTNEPSVAIRDLRTFAGGLKSTIDSLPVDISLAFPWVYQPLDPKSPASHYNMTITWYPSGGSGDSDNKLRKQDVQALVQGFNAYLSKPRSSPYYPVDIRLTDGTMLTAFATLGQAVNN